MSFPEGFYWGAAAASYQIEGAYDEDGRGLSVWDMFCRQDQAVYGGDSGDIACDHYHRFRQDIALMKRIGLKAYRLSISWPRIFPEGTGQVNVKGLDFYQNLVDALREAGIEPFVTLFHWDYPYELYCRGGWLNPDSSAWFADYTAAVVEALSDRVRYWITINEPQVFVVLGHQNGQHAPGLRLDWPQLIRIGHNVLLAHGKAVQAIRDRGKQDCRIGWAPVGVVSIPAADDPRDIEAAQEAMFTMNRKDLWCNTWWMDPVFKGIYPEDGLELFGRDGPDIRQGDMELIKQPLDFFGMNTYHAPTVRAGAGGKPETVAPDAGGQHTLFHWPVTPDCLYWGPRFFYERYGLPIVITENGLSNPDWVSRDGRVHDPQRIDYTSRHLEAVRRAIDEDVSIQGYMHWSIMDNFEWAEGYRHRFGLIHVDYQTQKRTLKDSAEWYSGVIADNGP